MRVLLLGGPLDLQTMELRELVPTIEAREPEPITFVRDPESLDLSKPRYTRYHYYWKILECKDGQMVIYLLDEEESEPYIRALLTEAERLDEWDNALWLGHRLIMLHRDIESRIRDSAYNRAHRHDPGLSNALIENLRNKEGRCGSK